MRRLAALALAAAGCLEPGRAHLLSVDEQPPRILATRPAAGDGGAAELRSGEPMEVVFSEAMEPESLPGGIALFEDEQEVLLVLAAPPPGPERADDPDQPYGVQARPAARILEPGPRLLVLVLRVALRDAQGNALPEEVRIEFRVTP
ncbi:MAG: hypothetical protein HYZ28_07710 [Myxococcales bacterium]|nr:hypothetical protein [Myxococcales bacterium]